MAPGLLVPLKTTLELNSSHKVVEVWVVGVEKKKANATLSLVRNLIPEDGTLAFQHLKRFAKLNEVPESVRIAFNGAKAAKAPKQNDLLHLHKLISKDGLGPSSALSTKSIPPVMEEKPLLLVVCLISTISRDSLTAILSELDLTSSPIVITTSVPLLAPTSSAQASRWTETHWPTVYKKNNPFGPHPSIVFHAQAEIENEARQWMALAHDVARKSSGCEDKPGIGEAVGVVIIERINGTGKVIAVAGDARWAGWEETRTGNGNPSAHAVMRAIAMVAASVRIRNLRKRQEIKENSPKNSGPLEPLTQLESFEERTSIIEVYATPKTGSTKKTRLAREVFSPVHVEVGKESCDEPAPIDLGASIFLDRPLSQIEAHNFDPMGNSSGYLCLNLEIYTTHEPCVMCSMAILHSRFGRVIFEKQMFQNGGLTADSLLGLGLFWRKELNWTMLAWQLQTSLADIALDESPDFEA